MKMDFQPQATRTQRRSVGLPVVLLAISLSLSPGCVVLGPFVKTGDAAAGAVCQIVTTWDPRVAFTPDPARGGTSGPGLMGRLYLFGPQLDFPLAGDGSVTVDLYQEKTTPAGAKEMALVEQWKIDRDTLRRLQKRDMIGIGYTLFLPWGTYRPETSQIQLKLRYDPLTGTPLYAPPTSLTLEQPPATLPAPTPVAQCIAATPPRSGSTKPQSAR